MFVLSYFYLFLFPNTFEIRCCYRQNSPDSAEADQPSRYYAYNIIKRSPILKLARGHQMDSRKISQSRRVVIAPYLMMLHDLFQTKNIPPEFIINIDETPTMLDNNHARVIVDSTYKPELPRKRNITITLAISMNGAPLASQLLTHKDSVLDDYRSLEYHNVYLDSNDSGYQDNDTFLRYVKHALGPLLQLRTQSRFMSTPIVLLVDGHYSHKSEAFISWCRFSNILPIIPPPNTTQSVQPLDCGVNAVFKSKLQNYLDDALFSYAYYHFFFSSSLLDPLLRMNVPLEYLLHHG